MVKPEEYLFKKKKKKSNNTYLLPVVSLESVEGVAGRLQSYCGLWSQIKRESNVISEW